MQQNLIDSSRPRPVRRCRWCQQPIQSRANVCHVCGRHQSRWWQLWRESSVVISFVLMVATVGLYHQAKQERIASSEALRQTQIAANTLTKMTRILGHGANVFGGPTQEYHAKIREYQEELRRTAILPPNVEAQIQKDLQEICEKNKRRLTGNQPSERILPENPVHQH